jgi:hypothetical protein
MTNENKIFTQITIFAHIEDISHKWSMKVNFLLKWPYFYTLRIFHTNDQWKSNFHSNDHIFTHRGYSSQFHKKGIWLTLCGQSFCFFSLCSLFFEFLDFFMVVVVQVQSFIDRWYSWLDHRDDERSYLIKLIKLFLIDNILDSDDSSFFRYNHLLSFVCCVWNKEHLSNVLC